jgi:hypothetical protein
LTLSNTSSFLTRSVKLIFSILLKHHISKLSRCFNIWLSTGISSGSWWAWKRSFGFYKCRGNFWLTDELVSFQEGLFSTDLVLLSGPARYSEKIHVCLKLSSKVGQHDKSSLLLSRNLKRCKVRLILDLDNTSRWGWGIASWRCE